MEAVRYAPRYTVAGSEQREGDWKLWDGLPVSMSPSPDFRHQRSTFGLAKLIDRQLEESAPCHCEVVFGRDWRIAPFTVVRPDLMVVCDPFEGQWVNVPPTLIIEILSPATEHKDRTAKRELYALHGVRHSLLAQPDDSSVEALTLADGEYQPAWRTGMDMSGWSFTMVG